MFNSESLGKVDLSTKTTFVFDAFGTLFKTQPLADTLESIIGHRASELLNIWRKKQLEYSWLRNQMGAYLPFNQITKEALDFAMRKMRIDDTSIPQLLLPVYEEPQLIAAAFELLEHLNSRERQTAILSNGTPAMLEQGVQRTGISNLVNQVISVDLIKKYKPSPEVYQMALNQLKVAQGSVVFFSSNQWDVSGASTFGLDAVWVNQYEETKESLPFGNVMEVGGLNEVIYLLQ